MLTHPPTHYRNFSKIVRAAATAKAPAYRLWNEIASIGGCCGWYYHDWLWQLRGALDEIAGGVGMRCHLKPGRELIEGDVLDFYRVTAIEPDRQLTLQVEMKLPGEGAFEFILTPLPDGQTKIEIAAYFEPKGIFGLAYWLLFLPVHLIILRGLARTLARRAEAENSTSERDIARRASRR